MNVELLITADGCSFYYENVQILSVCMSVCLSVSLSVRHTNKTCCHVNRFVDNQSQL